jgi:type I restriction enzyme S subunit
MNPDWLLKHFEQMSEAPDAVPRLRRFILDLAVRGKLVEQDPADEPALELLKKIEAEKERLVKEGEIKKLEVFQTVADDELPFSIPSGWYAMRMGWLARKLGAGSTPLGGKSVYQDEGIPFLRSQNIHDDGLQLEDVALITRTVHDRMSGTHIQDQDILLNITGASIGRCALVPSSLGEGNVSQHVAIIRLFVPAIREFIHLSLISPSYQKLIMDVQVGVSREGLSMQRLRLFPMLIPPLAEQHRIAAKVDELMALCDELEGTQAKRERRRARLVAATLHGLNNGDDSSEPGGHPTFSESARFYFNHLPRLTARPEHIQQLRQTILNLAVRGKLVPQDPRDEPAPHLLKRIQRKRELLVKEGKIRKGETLPTLSEAETPFDVPQTWLWVRVPEVADSRLGKMLDKAKNKGTPRRYLRNVNVRWFDFDLSDLLEMRFEDSELEEFSLRNGDVLICEGGEPGRCAVWDERETDIFFQKAIHRVRFFGFIVPTFFIRVLCHDVGSGRLEQFFTGVGIKHFTGKGLSRYTFPLPPLAEQHRIVAKVDQLMALCDELETRLTTTATTRRQLLEATIHEALKKRLLPEVSYEN